MFIYIYLYMYIHTHIDMYMYLSLPLSLSLALLLSKCFLLASYGIILVKHRLQPHFKPAGKLWLQLTADGDAPRPKKNALRTLAERHRIVYAPGSDIGSITVDSEARPDVRPSLAKQSRTVRI